MEKPWCDWGATKAPWFEEVGWVLGSLERRHRKSGFDPRVVISKLLKIVEPFLLEES